MRMGLNRWQLRRVPGLQFWKLLGTGTGDTFTVRDADSHHWALLTVWQSAAEAAEFEKSSVVRSWQSIARTSGRLELSPVSSRGTWGGVTPFFATKPSMTAAPIAVITRARVKPRYWWRFNRAVPPVSQDLYNRDGVLLRFGIGEAPVGLQGTFSIWRDSEAINNFAYRSAAHTKVVADTETFNWYSEELFARFFVVAAAGTIKGANISAWVAR